MVLDGEATSNDESDLSNNNLDCLIMGFNIPPLDVSIAAQEISSAGYCQCVRQFKA